MGLVRAEFLRQLRCPTCRANIEVDKRDPGVLACVACGRSTPIVRGIPRFVDTPAEELARRTQASFGYEWTHFSDWRQSGETNFNDYFQDFDLKSLADSVVLDAGCGMGRHARQVAAFAGRIVAVDFSRAIDAARANVEELGNVDCVQGDIMALPLADDSFDFVYSLGVLHHLPDTERALAQLVKKVRLGGRLRIYLYWKRHAWQGRLLSVVSAARMVTTKMPFSALRVACWLLSVVLFGAVVLPYRLLSALGVRRHESWPLFVYARYPFRVLYNDQFDRFSAPIEKRYDADEVANLLTSAGLSDVRVRPCFGWIADGVRRS